MICDCVPGTLDSFMWKNEEKQQMHITRASEKRCSLGPVFGTESGFEVDPLSFRSKTKLISEVVSFNPSIASSSPDDTYLTVFDSLD